MRVLLNSFHLNGHTVGFHTRTSMLQLKLELPRPSDTSTLGCPRVSSTDFKVQATLIDMKVY